MLEKIARNSGGTSSVCADLGHVGGAQGTVHQPKNFTTQKGAASDRSLDRKMKCVWLEELPQRFPRLNCIKLQRHTFHEVTHHLTAHVAQSKDGTQRRPDVDIYGRAGK